MEPLKPSDQQTNPAAPDQAGDSATFRQRRAEWETWDKQQTRQRMMFLVIGNCFAVAVFGAVVQCFSPAKFQRPDLIAFAYISSIVVWLFIWPIVVLRWKNLTRWGRKTSSPKLSL